MKTCLFVITITIVLATAISAAPPDGVRMSPDAVQLTYDNSCFIDANAILMFMTNHGVFGQDLTYIFGYSEYGTWWPFNGDTATFTYPHSPQYAAGLWMAGMVGAELRVAIANNIDDEYTTGPMNGTGFFPDEPAFKVYKLYSDSLEGNPNDDYTNWPVSQGAPVDDQGDPAMLGDRMLWAVFNDADPDRHLAYGGSTAQLGVEVQQTIWGYDSSDPDTANTVFIRYKLYNNGGNTISDFYLSLYSDADVGNLDDDFAGCDTANEIFFAYNGDDADDQYDSPVPAMGYRILKGPVVPSPGNTAYFDGHELDDYANLEMTSFRKYTYSTKPTSSAQTYNVMKGLLANGDPLANGTTFDCPGDPESATGELDATPFDRVLLASCGPMTFNPGDSQYVLLAFSCARGTTYLNSVTKLKTRLSSFTDFPVGVEDGMHAQLPNGFAVGQNYPNPFNPKTTIHYTLPARAHVRVDVFNVLGQKVTTLVDATQPAGDHQVVWNGTDQSGKSVSSGFYFYRVQAGDDVASKKMVLVK